MIDIPPFPPPGEMIDIGTHKIHMLSQGEGTPLVVLNSGTGNNVLTWKLIQSEIAKFTQVMAYDRSGLGWSERGTNPINHENTVNELHALLASARTSSPYVLVGHSGGGMHMRLFAETYPDLTAGLVFVDSFHENILVEFKKMEGYATYFDDVVSLYGELSQKSHIEIVSHFLGKNISDLEELPESEQPDFERLRPSVIKTTYEDLLDFASKVDKKQDIVPGTFGDKPLIALSATKPTQWGFSEQHDLKAVEIYRNVHAELADLSSCGKQILVENAAHYIHHDQPQVVIDAIREVVDMVRLKE